MKKRLTDRQLSSEFEKQEETEKVDCKSVVMQTIKCGRVKMRARWFILTEYFGLRTSWILLVLMAVGIINLGLFILSRSPGVGFFEFGGSGYAVLLQTFPYSWLALAASIIIVTILMMRCFSATYRWHFRIFVGLLLVGVFFMGGLTFATGLNESLYYKLVEGPAASGSLLARLYCWSANRSLDSDRALLGEVLYIENEEEFVVQTPELEVITVVTTLETRWLQQDQLQQFDIVKSLGEKQEEMFYATHIKIDNDGYLTVIRDGQDCINKQKFAHRREVAEERRQVIRKPYTPIVGQVQLIKSIK